MREINLPITISDIDISNDRRAINQATVKRLADSIEQIGLRHPITVRERGDRYQLIAGRHRIAAHEKLGLEHIQAVIVKMTNDEARLWEIAENLHRSELTKLERDEQVAEWIKITERISFQSETKSAGRPEGGVRAAARELGIDNADAHRAVKVASLSESAKEAAREEGLDNNRSALLAASRERTPEAQVTKLRNYKSEPAITKADAPDMYVVARQLAAKYSPLELTHLIDHLADIIKDAA